MSSYYNNIPITEYINIDNANIDTLDAETIKTKNLYIDTIKTSDNIKTQKITLDNKDIEEITTSTTSPYTDDNNKITSKGYVDEQINNITPDLSTCVKNNEDQTLTNKFIMSNTGNEININKLKIKDYDNNNNIDTIEKIKTAGISNNDTLTTLGFISYYKPGSNYYVSDVRKGEIFNDYINNTSTGNFSHSEGSICISSGYCSHSEGYNNKANGDYSHCEGASNTITGNFSHCEGASNSISGTYSHCEGQNNIVSSLHSHCEGADNTIDASSYFSHCEGRNNKTQAYQAHAEGYNTTASGSNSHSEGTSTKASGSYSHAGGFHTQADQQSQTAIGEYNTTGNTYALLSVGNGTADNARSDALVVKSTGEVIINSTKSGTTPKLTIGTSKSLIGTTALSSSTQSDDEKIATKYYVDNALSGKANTGDIPDISNCLTTSNIYIGNNFKIRARYRLHSNNNTYYPQDFTNIFGYLVFNPSTKDVYFTGELKVPVLNDFETTNPYFSISYISFGSSSADEFYTPNDIPYSSSVDLINTNADGKIWIGKIETNSTAGGIDNVNFYYVYLVKFADFTNYGNVSNSNLVNNTGCLIRFNSVKFTRR